MDTIPKWITKQPTCPSCDSPWKNISRAMETQYAPSPVPPKLQQHVNGGNWVSIEYSCGRVDEYIPNFSSVQVRRPCRYTPELSALVRDRQTALNAVKAFAVKTGIDSVFLEVMTDALDRTKYDLENRFPKEDAVK